MSNAKVSPFKFRLFVVLWLAGMAGVLSLLLLPLPPIDNAPPTAVLKLLLLIQPTLLTTVAVLVGVALAPRVGLAAPLVEALAGAQGSPALKRAAWRQAIAPQLWPGILGGLVSGGVLSAIAALAERRLPPEFSAAAAPPLPVRFLYGGITEEILMRWGLMTLLLWLGWRFGQRRRGQPQPLWVGLAIGLSALLFAAAHLPFVAALGIPLTPLLVGYILLQNSVFAVVAGYLYWRYGLEAAIAAHLVVHATLLVVSLGL